MKKIGLSIMIVFVLLFSIGINEAFASDQTNKNIICMKSSSKSSFEQFMNHIIHSMIVKR